MLASTNSLPVQITEGSAEVKIPSATFYNKAQTVNRDLSVLAIKVFSDFMNTTSDPKYKRFCSRTAFLGSKGKTESPLEGGPAVKEVRNKLRILDGLSATGIRSLRYALELENVDYVVANDISEKAFDSMKANIALNGLSVSSGVIALNNDFNAAVSSKDYCFNVVDVDPYGSPSRFVTNSLNSIQDGGMLCVTSTDFRNFAKFPEASYCLYGTMTTKSKYCHEIAIRALLSFLDRTANSFGRHIVPLISLKINFYLRVFVRVFASRLEAKNSIRKNGMAFICKKCNSFSTQEIGAVNGDSDSKMHYSPATIKAQIGSCEVCDSAVEMVGPIWLDPLHDKEFLKKSIEEIGRLNNRKSLANSSPNLEESGPKKTGNLENQSDKAISGKKEKFPKLATVKTLKSILTLASRELPSFLYHEPCRFAKFLGLEKIPQNKVIFSALLNAGYNVSMTHLGKNYFKTDAPCLFLWAIFKTYIAANTQKPLAKKILAKNFKIKVDLTLNKKAVNMIKRREKLVHYGKNLGPLKRAKLE